MPPRTLAVSLFAALVFARSSIPVSAQSCAKTFGPMASEFRTSQTVFYDQVWSQVARATTTNGWTFAWSEGQDIYARRYDVNLSPLGGQFLVDTLYNAGTQDEPAISYGTSGNFLISWSERNAYDGSGMGIFGRVYDPNGVPITAEFPVNSITWASQWRPLLAPTTTGGWVAAWSGDSDGNAYIRILDSNGAFLTGDILVNTYTYDAQVDTAAAVNPSGTIFAAFVDFSSHGGFGSGLNLFGRTFNASGVPLQPQEFLLTSFSSNGNQRLPRVAADGLGRFVVTWEDEFGDGSSYGIFARLFDGNGAPLAPEFVVNTTTAGYQGNPRIAVDQLGRFLITWEDFSSGQPTPNLRARRFNGQANPQGPDFVVNEHPSTGAFRPVPVMNSTGSDIMIAYDAPGAPGDGLDVLARRFASTTGPQTYCSAKVNSQGCQSAIGFSGSPSASISSPFLITASDVLNHKIGLLLYGYGSAFTPYQGVTICVAPPLKRMPAQNSGGNAGSPDCSGAFSLDFNARIQSGIDPALIAGSTVSARWYYRDPADPAGYSTGLSNALRFAICP